MLFPVLHHLVAKRVWVRASKAGDKLGRAGMRDIIIPIKTALFMKLEFVIINKVFY